MFNHLSNEQFNRRAFGLAVVAVAGIVYLNFALPPLGGRRVSANSAAARSETAPGGHDHLTGGAPERPAMDCSCQCVPAAPK